MMNEVIQIFLGAYHENIAEDYASINYFDSCIVLAVTICMLVGALAMACITAWGTFKIINGVFGRV